MFNPWFMFSLWLNVFRAMVFAPWVLPLQAARMVLGAQTPVARDWMRVSERDGQRTRPPADAQKHPAAEPQSEPAARAERSRPDAAALIEPPAEAQAQPSAEAQQPDGEALRQCADFMRELLASQSHERRPTQRHKPRSPNRVRTAAVSSRTHKASIRSKSKRKKRRAARRMGS